MTWEFRVVNDWGTVQIDDTYANLALKHAQTYQTGPPASQYYGSDLTFSFAGATPFFAYRCTAGYATVFSIHESGGVWTVRMRCSAGVGTPITVYVFDRPIVSAGGWGFDVFDAAGNLTFSSGYKYMRVVDWVSPAATNPPADYALDPSRIYAVCQGSFAYSQYWVSPAPPTDPNARGDVITEICGAVFLGSVLRLGTYEENVVMNQPFYQGFAGGSAQYLIIDVTGL
ncbi:hypothetical protein CURE108131_25190 [Cupriavidus respiraculi]|uniref:Uncharacterized protein n=1 Tax=Cupriavidus respiraculi TaxID=195930 RepID=A0ABN7ZHZ3_9BURK|nr:hypothetical protein [Cupriavidus respiraculi]CAG9184326.1 hypothetical protein LMG21510_05069 [Cupriavidus respiraculi]